VLITADIGNTNSVFGLWQQSRLLDSIRISTDATKTEYEWYVLLKTWIKHGNEKQGDNKISSVSIASVVPNIKEALFQAFDRLNISHIIELNYKSKVPLEFNYLGRETLGADRIANAISATKYYHKNVIVVDFGTAITFCLIKNNIYYGGVIAPGYSSALRALISNTAKLPQINFTRKSDILGSGTIDSMENGMYFGWKGLIEEILFKLRKKFNSDENFLCIATGGISKSLDFLESNFDIIDPDLTLKGLKYYYELSKKTNVQ